MLAADCIALALVLLCLLTAVTVIVWPTRENL